MAAAAPRRTKIVATIGPVSENHDTLRALAEAGMDGARLNFSHGSHADMARRNELIREVQEEIGRPLCVIADLQGPKLRIGELPQPVMLERGSQVTLVGAELPEDGSLPVLPAVIGDVLRPGHDVLIDDGLIRLKVEDVEHGRVHCAILVGGSVSAH
jgi:pyruvate kinase